MAEEEAAVVEENAEQTKQNIPETKKHLYTYGIVVRSDIHEEVQPDIIEIIIMACEKNPGNNERMARMIKEYMDIKYRPSWQVIVGESFAFEISYEKHNLMFMYFAGYLAICVWKCARV